MGSITRQDGTTIAYRALGGGPIPVLFIHGWMVSGAVFDPLLAALDLGPYRVLVPDLRGSGASGRPASGYDLATLAGDLAAILEAEKTGPARLVGHSMGGQLAQLLAATRPELVAGAVALNPVPAAGLPLPPDAVGLFRGSGGNRGSLGTILDLACKQLPASERERLVDDSAATAPASVEQCFDAWTAGGFAGQLGEIRAPFLVVATDDPFLPPAFLRASVVDLIPGARLVHLPGPGHYPQCERPAETAAIVGAFLAGVRPST